LERRELVRACQGCGAQPALHARPAGCIRSHMKGARDLGFHDQFQENFNTLSFKTAKNNLELMIELNNYSERV
jgi:hypothetical protein